MGKIWDWVIDHALGEIRVIKDAPVAYFCCVLIIAPIAYWGYWGASWRYGVIIENKESLISYLQRQLDDLQKDRQANSLHPPSTKEREREQEQRNPDAMYQLGSRVGTVVAAEQDLGQGIVSFKRIDGTGDFNENHEFEYREWTAKIESYADKFIIRAFGKTTQKTFIAVKANIIGRRQ
jgi:hypothetical protein